MTLYEAGKSNYLTDWKRSPHWESDKKITQFPCTLLPRGPSGTNIYKIRRHKMCGCQRLFRPLQTCMHSCSRDCIVHMLQSNTHSCWQFSGLCINFIQLPRVTHWCCCLSYHDPISALCMWSHLSICSIVRHHCLSPAEILLPPFSWVKLEWCYIQWSCVTASVVRPTSSKTNCAS